MIHKSTICLAMLCAWPAMSAWALGDATTAAAEAPWARWQGRVSFGSAGAGLRLDTGKAKAELASTRVTSFTAMGDYYFTGSLAGAKSGGGFRATSGLVIGSRAQVFNGLVPSSSGGVFNVDRRVFGQASQLGIAPDATGDSASLSYIGIGYTGLSARRGWIFNADLGLVSLNAGNGVKLGRVFSGSAPSDGVRDTRVSPVVQLGASYSF